MVWPKGKPMPPEQKEKLRIRNLGNKYNLGGRSGGGGHTHNKETCNCPFHTKLRTGSYNPAYRGNKQKWKYSLGWKAARRKVWERDKVCRACGLPPVDRRLDVHHIKPRRLNGSNDLDNLVGLHKWCHRKVEAGKLQIIAGIEESGVLVTLSR